MSHQPVSAFAEEIRPRPNVSYKFYLNAPRPGTRAGQFIIQGLIREVGSDFVRIRGSSSDRTRTDIVLPMASILYFEETHHSNRGE